MHVDCGVVVPEVSCAIRCGNGASTSIAQLAIKLLSYVATPVGAAAQPRVVRDNSGSAWYAPPVPRRTLHAPVLCEYVVQGYTVAQAAAHVKVEQLSCVARDMHGRRRAGCKVLASTPDWVTPGLPGTRRTSATNAWTKRAVLHHGGALITRRTCRHKASTSARSAGQNQMNAPY